MASNRLAADQQGALDAIQVIHDQRKKEYAKLHKQYGILMQELQDSWTGIQALHNAAHEIQGTPADGTCPFGGSNRTPPGRSDTRLVVLEVLDAAVDDEHSKLSAIEVYHLCISRGWDPRNAATPKGAVRQMLRRMADDDEISREKNSKGSTVYWSEA